MNWNEAAHALRPEYQPEYLGHADCSICEQAAHERHKREAIFECGCALSDVGAVRHPAMTGAMSCPIHLKPYPRELVERHKREATRRERVFAITTTEEAR